VLETGLDAEVRSLVTDIKEKFSFFFGVYVEKCVLGRGDNLSKTLWSKVVSAAEAQKVAKLTLTKIPFTDYFRSLLSRRLQPLMFMNQPCQGKEKLLADTKQAQEIPIFHVKLKTTSIKYILKS